MKEPIKGKTKYFEYVFFPNQSFIYIKVLPSLKTNGELKIIPLSDIHIGAKGFKEEKFISFIKYISEEPVLCCVNGDTVEMALPDSPSGVFEQTMSPTEQMLYLREHLKPIEEKILWALPGNHEERPIKRSNIDPLEWVLRSLKTNVEDRYSQFPISATIEYEGHKFNFFVQHGASGATTPGSKINAASKPLQFIKNAHFIIMGHVHSSDQSPQNSFNLKVEGEQMTVAKHLVYVIIAPAFYEYFNTYGAKKGYAPPSTGAVVPYLWKNGTYGVSS
ncbi:MAG: metallophosphoesterase [Patescibacteria group bacterium]|nr:metallophosphoesterase [Patescibacteria group bacterium]